MRVALRHLRAILLLPFMVIVVVPWVLLHGHVALRLAGAPAWAWLRAGAGAVLFLGGLAFVVRCAALLGRVGGGTLAPWDPTRHLVVAGPYAHVRNPMIAAVAVTLCGEATFFGSPALGVWAGSFIAINHAYFVLSEERGLERRFGEAYRRYKAHVPRWIPRLRGWTG